MNRSVILLAASVLAGCYQSPIASGEADVAGLGADVADSSRYTEGSPVALGMIAFLNDASTTFELLDDDVGLDRRAARALIAHRDGPDGVLGYQKDDLYDTVEEIDARYYVGKTALARIEGWALSHGWVAQRADDHLGTWDGVSFTLGEAEATVAFVNSASAVYLDDDLGLDARAVNSIVEAGEITSVQQLAGLFFVGRTALRTLKDAATAVPVCDQPGWTQDYVYDEGDGQWRETLPAGLVDVIDELLLEDAWCGEAEGQPVFVKVAIDRDDCVDEMYYVELRQDFLGGGAPWYIEFEVNLDFDYVISACEV